MSQTQNTQPKYQGTRIGPGLYLQHHDDGETISVVMKILTPSDTRDRMLWWHGVVPDEDLKRLAEEIPADDAEAGFDLRWELETFAQNGGWDTKREAVTEALGLAGR